MIARVSPDANQATRGQPGYRDSCVASDLYERRFALYSTNWMWNMAHSGNTEPLIDLQSRLIFR